MSTAADGRWDILVRQPKPGAAWINVRIRSTIGRRGSYWTGYNPCEGRLARSTDERRMFAKRPVLWRAVVEVLGSRYGRAPGEYAQRLLDMLSTEDRARLLRELTSEERAKLEAFLVGSDV